ASSVAAELSSARTISISFILCTGLKKCIPATRAGAFNDPASSVMLSAEVFEAITASAGASRSMSAKSASFRSSRSGAASMTNGAPASASSPRPPPTRRTSSCRTRRRSPHARSHAPSSPRLVLQPCQFPIPQLPTTNQPPTSNLQPPTSNLQPPTSSPIHQFPERRHRVIDLLLGVVEVRRHADAGAGTMIDDDAALDQLVGDGGAVGDVDDHRAAALAIVERRVQ